MTENASINRLQRFYAWWIRELSKALTPRHAAARAWRTLLLRTSDGIEISIRDSGGTRRIGTLRSDATPDQVAEVKTSVLARVGKAPKRVLLRLAADDVVQRTIQIPEAARDLVDVILENQMERMVPWPLNETRYGYRIAGQSAVAPDQVDVLVVATRTSIMDSALHRARAVGLIPSGVDFLPDLEAASAIELMSLEPDTAKKMASRLHTTLALSLALSASLGVLGAYQAWDRNAQNKELETQIAGASSRMGDIKRLNDENAALREQRERLVKRKVDDPPAIILIEALSRVLPDSAFLEELEIHARETRIVGKSADPTGLITILEDTPEFEDVRFAAPTTRDEGEAVGTFSIVARAQSGTRVEKVR